MTNGSSALKVSRRELTPAEKRFLRAKIRSLAARGRRTSTVYLPITAAVIVALWLVTILVSDAPLLVISAFWLIAGAIIALWVARDMRKDAGHLRAMADSLESALTRNAADVYDVKASRFAEFEEIEDEGACYAFELEGGLIVFIVGQEFYPAAKFPSLDFSLVYILDEHGASVDMVIEKRGERVLPARRIPAAMKRKLEIPGHLETRAGRIDDLESRLKTTVLAR